ncbi:MAG: hypothetical protein V2A79_08055 [Planctomycetota bacterium]
MADATITLQMSAVKGAQSIAMPTTSWAITMANNVLFTSRQTINFAAGELVVMPGDIQGPCAALLFYNADETKGIYLALDAPMANKFATIPPLGFAVVPPNTNVIYAQTNDGAASSDLVIYAIDL